MKKTLTILALSLLGTGCVQHYAHSVSASSSLQGTPITGHAEAYGILTLTAPDVDATTGLREKCPSGHVSNVVAEGRVRNWFGVVQVYTVDLTAICNP